MITLLKFKQSTLEEKTHTLRLIYTHLSTEENSVKCEWEEKKKVYSNHIFPLVSVYSHYRVTHRYDGKHNSLYTTVGTLGGR